MHRDHLTAPPRPSGREAFAAAEIRPLRTTLWQLQIFLATAREGSTRAAGERICRSQSATSNTLLELEKQFGLPLFDRVGNRLVLNQNGRMLVPKAVALIEQAVELEHMFQAGYTSPLAIAASLTIGEFVLPDIIARWKQGHPHGTVQVHVANTRDVIAALAAFETDVGFIEGAQTHPDLVVRPWIGDDMVILAAPDHPLNGKKASRRELRDASWALREPGSGTREEADRWLVSHLGALRVGYELGSAESIKRIVASSDALGCISRRAAAVELSQGRLIELRSVLPPARRQLSIVVHRNKQLNASTQAFYDHCIAWAHVRNEANATAHQRSAQ